MTISKWMLRDKNFKYCCSTEVENIHHFPDVMGSTPVGRWASFILTNQLNGLCSSYFISFFLSINFNPYLWSKRNYHKKGKGAKFFYSKKSLNVVYNTDPTESVVQRNGGAAAGMSGFFSD